MVVITAIVATHDITSYYLHTCLNILSLHLLVAAFTFSCALGYGLLMLKSHQQLQKDLIARIEERDRMQDGMRTAIAQLEESVLEADGRNQQLTSLAEFTEAAHGCTTENEIVDCLKEYTSLLLPNTEGSIYLAYDNPRWPCALTWPPTSRFPSALNSARCEMLKPRSHAHRNSSQCADCRSGNSPDAITLSDCQRIELDGQIFATLHIRADQTKGPLGREFMSEPFSRSLILLMSNQIAIALANIRSRQSLGEMVIRDPLTGTFNRRYLEETLTREIEKAKRSRTSLAVLMLDLDHFKAVNDVFGHPTGDAVLKQFALTLTREVRASDIVSRYGGEEFVVVLENASAMVARGRAEHLRRSIHSLSSVVRHQRMITASIGVAVMPDNGNTSQRLIKAADDALYLAKKSGRDKVVVARPLRSPVEIADASPKPAWLVRS